VLKRDYAVVMPLSPTPGPTICLQVSADRGAGRPERDSPCAVPPDLHTPACLPFHFSTSRLHPSPRKMLLSHRHRQSQISPLLERGDHALSTSHQEPSRDDIACAKRPLLNLFYRITKACDSWPMASTAALQHSWSHLPTSFLCDVARLTSSPEHDPRFAPTSRRRSTSLNLHSIHFITPTRIYKVDCVPPSSTFLLISFHSISSHSSSSVSYIRYFFYDSHSL
jgi:hypothetical protein